MQSDYLAPGPFVDSESAPVRAFAHRAVGDASDPTGKAVRLFEAVRDGIWYDPFTVSTDPQTYRASAAATSTANWCVPKAVLLTAAARAVGIPARLGFADVRNHLQTPKLRERMRGVDVFAFHGYTDLQLDGRWVKATPAFNAELCARFGVAPIAFDGRTDALLHEYTPGGGRYMEYVRDRGVHTDLPLTEILATFREVYGSDMFAGAEVERGDDTFRGPGPVKTTDDDPQADWTSPGVYRCAPGVHRIPLPLPNDGLRAVNIYAVADRDGWTLIDAGWALAESRDRLAAALGVLGAGFGDVHRFLVTHAHRDHYTLAVALRREFGTRVALGAGERPSIERLDDLDHMSGAVHVTRLLHAGAPALARIIEGNAPQAQPGDWTPPDEWIDDGAEIDLGVGAGARRLQAIATPGHTRGHVVFADEAAELLFAGDHVLPRITPSIGLEAVPPPSPLADFLASLELMTSRPDAALLPAHGPVGRRVHERVDELLAHHAKRLDATLAAVQDGCSTAYEVAAVLPWTRRDHRLDELDPFNAMLAVLETAAHLAVLATRGGVTASTVDEVVYYQT